MPFVDAQGEQAREEWGSGKSNNTVDIVISVLAVVASSVAATLAAGGANKWLAAAVASVPGACAALQQAVDFRGRANWYFLCSRRRSALVRRLEFGGDEKEVAEQVSALEVEMEAQWATIVQSLRSRGDKTQ